MDKFITNLLRSNVAFAFSIMFLVTIGTIHLWPTSWWFQVNTFTVPTVKAGEPVEIILDRRIRRPFFAEWSVVVQRWDNAGWAIYCEAHGTNNYRVDAILPTPVTLEWWSASECVSLSAGRYLIDANWVIKGGLLPDKVITLASNVFEVRS